MEVPVRLPRQPAALLNDRYQPAFHSQVRAHYRADDPFDSLLGEHQFQSGVTFHDLAQLKNHAADGPSGLFFS
jgi:hypothetical protein